MKEIVKDMLREYQRKRERAEQEQKERIREVYNVIPQIREIDQAIQKLGLEYTKCMIRLNDSLQKDYINNLKQEIESLKEEKVRLLKKHHYPPDYLEVQYQCGNCKDTGYIGNEKCSCFKQQLINRAYQQSNLGSILAKENFSTFNIELYPDQKYGDYPLTPRQNMINIVSICEGFVHNFHKDNGENLLFYGSTGLGKTFLCNCIAKELLDRGKVVVYLTAFNLFRILEQYRFDQPHTLESRQQLDSILTCDLLIIDDLGTELSNSFTISELFNIINTRLLERKKTIISTNLEPQKLLETYSQRVFSRISGHYKALEFYGPDLRWEK